MSLQQNLPPPSAPFVDADGRLTYDAISLLRILWSRTGFATGVGSDDLALLSVLNGIDAPQDPQARAEAASAFLAGVQPQTLAIDPTARALGSDGVFTGLAPMPAQSEIGEAQSFALMLLGPVYASISSAFLSGVTSFNGRTGAVALTSGDVTAALGYTPLDAAAASFAGSAAKLTTARNIAMTGDVTWNLNFDGSAAVTAAGTIAANAVTTAKILDSNVTLAKIANIADQTILGNNSGVPAAPLALTAAQVRTVLSLVIGTNVQAFSANLTTYAGIAPSANVQTFLGAANFGAMRTNLGLVIGADVQAYSANLAALAALATTGKFYYLSAANTWTAVTIGTGLTFSAGTLDRTAVSGPEVVSALGYTPYSAANPSGYISGITGANVIAALGYTPGVGSVTSVATDATLTGGPITGSGTLSVVSAPKLTTPRNFTYTGDVTGGPTGFDGSANVSIALTLAVSGVGAGSYGSGFQPPALTIDATGRVTSASAAAPITVYTGDMNSIIATTGTYAFTDISSAATNKPGTAAGLAQTFCRGATSNNQWQLFFPFTQSALYMRINTAGVWGAWTLFAGDPSTTYPGDASFTTTGASVANIVFDTPLTANRTCTFNFTAVVVGSRARVRRSINCTGAFTITVRTSTPTTLVVLSSPGDWADIVYDGSTWIVTAAGAAGPDTTKTANTVYAGPTTGAAATPAFRALVTADIPTATSGAAVPLLSGGNTWGGLQTLSAGGDNTPAATPSTTAIGYLGKPQNLLAGSYTTVMADAGKHFYHTSASAHTLTIASNAAVAFPIGTLMEGVNENGAGVLTIAITTDTLRWGANTGSRSVAANGSFRLLKVAATVWRLTGDGIT